MNLNYDVVNLILSLVVEFPERCKPSENDIFYMLNHESKQVAQALDNLLQNSIFLDQQPLNGLIKDDKET